MRAIPTLAAVPFRHRPREILALCLLGAAGALFAANPSLNLQVSSETAPAGGFAQLKITASAPALIPAGSLTLNLDPRIFGAVTSVYAFSATGDQLGYAEVSDQQVQAVFYSPTASFGQLPGLPILVVNVPVLPEAQSGAQSVIGVTAGSAAWQDQQGNAYSVSITPGTFTVGGALSVQSLTPGGGLLPAGTVVHLTGTGFDAGTRADIDGVSIASTRLVNSGQIDLTLAGAAELSGKQLHLSNSSGDSVSYFSSAAVIQNTPGSEQIFVPALPSPQYTVTSWGFPFGEGYTQYFSCLQNPNDFPVTAKYYGGSLVNVQTFTVTIPPYGLVVADNYAFARGDVTPPIYMSASAPLRMAEIQSTGLFSYQPAGNIILEPGGKTAALPNWLGVQAPPNGGWRWQTGTPAPQPLEIQIHTAFPFTISLSSGASAWLSVTPASGQAGAWTLTATPDVTSATPGTLTATLTITEQLPPDLAQFAPASATITLTLVTSAQAQLLSAVNAAGAAPAITSASPGLDAAEDAAGPLSFTPGALSFTAPASVSAAASFTVTSSSLGVTFSTSPLNCPHVLLNGNWGIQTTPATVQITAAADLPGTYSCAIDVESSGGKTAFPITFYAAASQDAPPVLTAVTSSASMTTGPIAPGELITVLGSGLGAAPAGLQLDSNQNVKTALGGTQLLINGIAAPLIYVASGQVNAIVPYEIGTGGAATVQVVSGGISSGIWGIPVAPSSPALFTLSASGIGAGAIVNPDGTINTASNPAPRGSIVQIYATGGGQTNPASPTGALAGGQANLALHTAVSIAGMDAQVIYAGAAPEEVNGVVQINTVVPQNASAGPALPVIANIGAVDSPAGVTIAVR